MSRPTVAAISRATTADQTIIGGVQIHVCDHAGSHQAGGGVVGIQ